jgi:hypothetical protein
MARCRHRLWLEGQVGDRVGRGTRGEVKAQEDGSSGSRSTPAVDRPCTGRPEAPSAPDPNRPDALKRPHRAFVSLTHVPRHEQEEATSRERIAKQQHDGRRCMPERREIPQHLDLDSTDRA